MSAGDGESAPAGGFVALAAQRSLAVGGCFVEHCID